MATGSVRLHRVVRTKPEKAYRAFLEADAMAKWLPPFGFTCRVHHMEATVGGTFKMSFHNFSTGNGHSFGGEYLELVANERIRYTDSFDDPSLPGKMTVYFEHQAGGGGALGSRVGLLLPAQGARRRIEAIPARDVASDIDDASGGHAAHVDSGQHGIRGPGPCNRHPPGQRCHWFERVDPPGGGTVSTFFQVYPSQDAELGQGERTSAFRLPCPHGGHRVWREGRRHVGRAVGDVNGNGHRDRDHEQDDGARGPRSGRPRGATTGAATSANWLMSWRRPQNRQTIVRSSSVGAPRAAPQPQQRRGVGIRGTSGIGWRKDANTGRGDPPH